MFKIVLGSTRTVVSCLHLKLIGRTEEPCGFCEEELAGNGAATGPVVDQAETGALYIT